MKRHWKVLVLTDEGLRNSFAEALAGRIAAACFSGIGGAGDDAGRTGLAGRAMNVGLEAAKLPSAENVAARLEWLLNY